MGFFKRQSIKCRFLDVEEIRNHAGGTPTIAGLTSTETAVLDGVTAGTVTASKAVVVDANKDIGDFRNLDAVNFDAGASGTAGTVDVFPATATRGKLTLAAVNNDGNTTTTISNAAMGQASVVSIPDPGAATANFLLTSQANDQSLVTATAAELNVLDGVTAGTVAASKGIVVDASSMLSWTLSSATVGNVEPLVMSTTLAGVGATGGRAKFALTTNVALGGWSNALKGIVTYGATGSTAGMGSAVAAELVMSAGTTTGTYAPLESEIVLGAGAAIGTATSFLYGNVTDDSATFNTNGYFMELGAGVVNTAGGLFDEVSEQAVNAQARLKVRIGGAVWYIPLCDTSALS